MEDYIWKGAIGEFEKKVGLPTGFVHSLAQEDDWTFVIKICPNCHRELHYGE
jgi:hypothetical protein